MSSISPVAFFTYFGNLRRQKWCSSDEAVTKVIHVFSNGPIMELIWSLLFVAVIVFVIVRCKTLKEKSHLAENFNLLKIPIIGSKIVQLVVD